MKNTLHKSFLLLALVAVIFASCKKEYESIEEIDERNLREYISKSGLTGMKPYNDSGMYYQVLTQGTGPVMEYSDKVPLVYTFKTIDGSYATTDTVVNHYAGYLGYFSLAGVRIGVKEILKNAGGQIRLLVPSRSAYGRNGYGSIPGNVSLDVTVRAITPSKLADYEDQDIKKYIAAKSLTGFVADADGIYSKITAAGTGSPITADSTVTFTYTGKLLNGTVFDSASADSPYSSVLKYLIPGWIKNIPRLKEGGSISLIIPSRHAYGLSGSQDAYGNSVIPAFATLYFDITVTAVAP